MIVKEHTGSQFEPIAAGVHPAVCITVAGIGQQETPWGNKEQVILTFEIPSIRREWTTREGEEKEGPANISNTFTATLSERSKLRAALEGWRDKAFTKDELEGFELSNILGKPCQLVIKHTHKGDKTYANITDILPHPKGADMPPYEAELLDYNPYNHNQAVLDLLPDWIASKVVPVTNEPEDAPPQEDEAGEELEEAGNIPF